MAELLYGAPVADALNAKSSAEVERLKKNGVVPTLAILRFGEQPDQISYEKGAMKRCVAVGVETRSVVLSSDVEQEQALSAVGALNDDDGIDGILLLQPLPQHLDADAVRNAIAVEKDVDATGDETLSRVLLGDENVFAPCTAQACVEILDYYGVAIEGRRVAVLGRSLVIGKPVSMMLLARNATVAICHSRTVDLPSVVQEAEIVVAAVGRERMVDSSFLRAGQTVIDVGINWNEEESRLYGDVDFDDAESVVSAITPVPKGVGAVTTSVLASHVVKAAARRI